MLSWGKPAKGWQPLPQKSCAGQSWLALPFTLNNGSPFPSRNIILFLSFVVIFVTLVVQGLTLPLLIRLPGADKTVTTNKEDKELELTIAHQVAINKNF